MVVEKIRRIKYGEAHSFIVKYYMLKRQSECLIHCVTWVPSVRGERRSGIRGEQDPGLITTFLSNYSACKHMIGAKAGLMLFVSVPAPTSPGMPQNDASSLIHS